jgi:hypothetical protein
VARLIAAGPCGTSAAPADIRTPVLTWTLLMLWPHLARYYATRDPNPYVKMGAKHGGGNGKSAVYRNGKESA